MRSSASAGARSSASGPTSDSSSATSRWPTSRPPRRSPNPSNATGGARSSPPEPSGSLGRRVQRRRGGLALGQEQREDRRLGAAEFEPATVGAGEVSGEREAESGAAGADPAFEDVRSERQIDAGALVADLHHHGRTVAARLHLTRAAAVLQGVLQQGGQDLRQTAAAGDDQETALT